MEHVDKSLIESNSFGESALPDVNQIAVSADTKTISYTNAYNIITKKILVNKMSIELLKTQILFNKKSKFLQMQNMKTAEDKITLIEQLNSLFDKQLTQFSPEIQEKCMDIYKSIQTLDTPSDAFMTAVNRLTELTSIMNNLSIYIRQLESTIPKESIVTNFNITS